MFIVLSFVHSPSLIDVQFIHSYNLFMQMFSHTGATNAITNNALTDVKVLSCAGLYPVP